jgi:hypothetical protein
MADSTPNWDKFFGHNDEPFPKAAEHCFGYVSFAEYLWKPLSDELWYNLLYRFHIVGLCIHKGNCIIPDIGHGQNHCDILLDDNGNVTDIRLVPPMPEEFNGTFWCFEERYGRLLANPKSIQVERK